MKFLPRDERFFELFQQQGELIGKAAGRAVEAFHADEPDWEAFTEEISGIETEGDQVTRETLTRLAETFITPFDPEDIHGLAVALDNVLDSIDGVVQRCRIFGLGRAPEPMRQLATRLDVASQALQDALAALPNNGDPGANRRLLDTEVECDGIYRKALYALFRQEPDALELLKTKEIYERLEATADKFAEASHHLEAIRLKNA